MTHPDDAPRVEHNDDDDRHHHRSDDANREVDKADHDANVVGKGGDRAKKTNNDGNGNGNDIADDDLGEYLETMDIDKDFNVWESFRQSLESTCTGMCAGSSAGRFVSDDDVVDGDKRGGGGGEAAAVSEKEKGKEKKETKEKDDKDGGGGGEDGDEEHPPPAPPGPPSASPKSPPAADAAAAAPSRASKDDDGAAAETEAELTKDERDFIRKWAARVHHEEVYSKYYRPVPREQKEMQELASSLGVPKDGGDGTSEGFGAMLKNKLNANLKQKGELQSVEPTKRPAVSAIFHPAPGEPRSILLKREPVYLRDRSSSKEGERELILVTRGIVVASIAPSGGGSAKKGGGIAHLQNMPGNLLGKVIRRKFESCDALSDVELVEDVAITEGGGEGGEGKGGAVPSAERSFAVTVRRDGGGGGGGGRPAGGRHRLVFTSGKVEQKVAWIEALQIGVIRARVLAGLTGTGTGGTKAGGGQAGEKPELLGWQHEVCRTSLFSAAVLNSEDMMKRALANARFKSRFDSVDSGGNSALHYATMRNNLVAMELLLEAGADANVKNGDKRTPMYFAQQYKFDKAADLLEKHGGVKATILDEASELFGQAAHVVRKTVNPPQSKASESAAGKKAGGAKKSDGNEKVSEVEAKAKTVTGVISDAMSAMRERGEILQNLDNKTADLENDASEFKDLARQLKEKAKKESKLFPF